MKQVKLFFFIFLLATMLFIAGCAGAYKPLPTKETPLTENSQESGEDPTQIFEDDSEEIENIDNIDVPLEESDIV